MTARRPILIDTNHSGISYGISRNVAAVDKDGKECRIALVVFEKGSLTHQLAISEDLIKFAGESIIDKEIAQALARL